MLGGHNQPPIVTEHRVTTANGTELEHCLFDETSYVNKATNNKLGVAYWINTMLSSL